jgi:hypothetical protein
MIMMMVPSRVDSRFKLGQHTSSAVHSQSKTHAIIYFALLQVSTHFGVKLEPSHSLHAT